MSPNIAIFAGKYSQGSVAIFPTKRGQYSPTFSYYFHFEKYFRSTDGKAERDDEMPQPIDLRRERCFCKVVKLGCFLPARPPRESGLKASQPKTHDVDGQARLVSDEPHRSAACFATAPM